MGLSQGSLLLMLCIQHVEGQGIPVYLRAGIADMLKELVDGRCLRSGLGSHSTGGGGSSQDFTWEYVEMSGQIR